MVAPAIKLPSKTSGAAANIAHALRRRCHVNPPFEPEELKQWLGARPARLSWVAAHRPQQAIELGLLERPIPSPVLRLRNVGLPLDPRNEASLRICFQLAAVQFDDVLVGLADKPHHLQTGLKLLEPHREGGDAPW